eukprot:TRINITY_DN5071_c0_g2_i5.p1 TRINITY_DN5071_c0_g2~~TRINITY_DN5071_c0_g2_i5.p1  ORF type:complete len:275 (+),score=89.27 TRINITY_DN5071_c0_g2_i5:121-825(+)
MCEGLFKYLKTAAMMSSEQRIYKESFIPLKICARRKPPSIAILYSLATQKNKKYLHEIPLSALEHTETASDVYNALIKSEPVYLEVVPKEQLMRVIERVLSNFDMPRSVNQENEKGEDVAEAIQAEASERDPLAECNLNESDKRADAQSSREAEELPEGFQRVFVEDLNQEVLMDAEGNLYDDEGNVIGQAAVEEMDDQYFDNLELACEQCYKDITSMCEIDLAGLEIYQAIEV